LKDEFEIKNLRKIKFYLGLQIEHLSNRKFIYQLMYTKKKSWSTFTWTMLILRVHHLMWRKKCFWLLEKDEKILGPQVSYLSAIGALMYLANYTRPDIAFAVNLLVRYNSIPTKRHWKMDKYILCYLRRTTKMRLFYSGSNS
jgi:hypothetical protein